MKKVLAIAVISLRAAVRSKVILSMVALLVVVIVALPLTIKGDGTLNGRVQILLTYTLSLVTWILSLLTLWAGCAAVSMDVAERQIHLVVTKPVRRVQIWAGKWLGLVILDAILLGVSGVAVYGLLRWTTRADRLTAEERVVLEEQVLAARKRITPTMPDIEREARRRVQERLRAEKLPAGVSVEDAVQATKNALLIQANAVPRGAVLAWQFALPHRLRPDRPLHFQYKFSSSDMSLTKVIGVWRFGGPEAGEHLERRREDTPEGLHSVRLPASVISPDHTLQVQFLNANPTPVAVLFPPADGLSVFVPTGSFEGNLMRAFLVSLFHLAFLAAVGVTAGSLFSMPVAAFVSMYMVVLLKFIPYIESMAARETILGSADPAARDPVLLEWIVKGFFTAMDFVMSPLRTGSPLESLGTGELVPWGLVGFVFLIKVVLYGGIIAAVGGWLFNRRELGLPS